MAITIENPTAEEIYEALTQVPESEVARLWLMLNVPVSATPEVEEGVWLQKSRNAAARFFEDEEQV